MTEAQLRDLIREVIAGLLPQRTVPQPGPATALVLFTGAVLGFDEACLSLTRLNPQMTLDWIQTPSAGRILDQDAIAAIGMTPAEKSLVASHDMLVVPTLSVNMVAKVVRGVGDCLASNVIAEFIMSGKPVVVATNAAARGAGARAGVLVRTAAKVLGGGGGGKDDLAQGGGQDPTALATALAAVKRELGA